MPIRSKDSYQKDIWDFIEDILVECSQCGKQATVKGATLPILRTPEKNIRLTCAHCGYNKRRDEVSGLGIYRSKENFIKFNKIRRIGAAIEPYFYQRLWLQTDCCGQTLWAYSYAHLNLIESHIAASLRERNGQPYMNKSIGSRIPKWMSTSKNRDEVLTAIAYLKNKR